MWGWSADDKPRNDGDLGGSIRVNGADISRVSRRSLRRFLGVVPQDTVLFHTTVRDNIKFAMKRGEGAGWVKLFNQTVAALQVRVARRNRRRRL